MIYIILHLSKLMIVQSKVLTYVNLPSDHQLWQWSSSHYCSAHFHEFPKHMNLTIERIRFWIRFFHGFFHQTGGLLGPKWLLWPPRNLANAMRNLGRRREAVELVWRHIGEAVDGVDVAQLAQVAQETVKTEKLVIAPEFWRSWVICLDESLNNII